MVDAGTRLQSAANRGAKGFILTRSQTCDKSAAVDSILQMLGKCTHMQEHQADGRECRESCMTDPNLRIGVTDDRNTLLFSA